MEVTKGVQRIYPHLPVYIKAMPPYQSQTLPIHLQSPPIIILTKVLSIFIDTHHTHTHTQSRRILEDQVLSYSFIVLEPRNSGWALRGAQ